MNRRQRHFRHLKMAALASVFWSAFAVAQFAWGANSAKKTAQSANVARSELVDINHASVDELKTLPGIQQAYAEKIVKNRPYANKTQLSSNGVIPNATYRKIRTLIIAKQ
jgi:DNA uptake protein ComE-like DNA-binding protein